MKEAQRFRLCIKMKKGYKLRLWLGLKCGWDLLFSTNMAQKVATAAKMFCFVSQRSHTPTSAEPLRSEAFDLPPSRESTPRCSHVFGDSNSIKTIRSCGRDQLDESLSHFQERNDFMLRLFGKLQSAKVRDIRASPPA